MNKVEARQALLVAARSAVKWAESSKSVYEVIGALEQDLIAIGGFLRGEGRLPTRLVPDPELGDIPFTAVSQ